MAYRALADLVLLLHFGFILFVTLGGLLLFRWRRVAYAHLPAAVWGVLIELVGSICPLTPLEQYLRQRGGEPGYAGDFIGHYLIAAIYPAGLTRGIQVALGASVLLFNGGVYWWWWRRRRIDRPSGNEVSTPSAGGAPRAGTRFANRAKRTEDLGLIGKLGFFGRRIWVTLSPRAGGAPRVAYDTAAIARTPSLTWIGHSTFLVRMDGVTFMTDPMFSDRASPFSFAGPRRLVAPGLPLAALPAVDFVLLSHDHYDHADVRSVRELVKRRVTFVVPLGLGEWVRRAGGEAIELDWWQAVELRGVRIQSVPAQHFSGRSITDGSRRLWSGWVVSGATRRFYDVGDTGYTPELASIGERLGPIDLATVPIGAYLPTAMMSYVHTTPEEALRVGLDAQAHRIVAMHFGTFDLADEPMDEPPRRFRAEAERLGLGSDRAWIMKVGETREW